MLPSDDSTGAPARGRPPITTRSEVERTALLLFARDGFDNTTMEEIAAALGVSRRTVFRYFPSKNDIVWGDFELVLDRLRALLKATPEEVPIMRALSDAIIESNRYELEQLPELRIRMSLITAVPALQAHSMLRYAAWRQVVAEYVATRRGESPDDLIPQTIGHATLGTSMAAFVHWVTHPGVDLGASLERAYEALAGGSTPEQSANHLDPRVPAERTRDSSLSNVGGERKSESIPRCS